MPVYGLMIAFHAFVLLHLADGPLWKSIAFQESYNCRQNWWTNILLINNYVNANRPVYKIELLNLKKTTVFTLRYFNILVHYAIVVLGVWHAIFYLRHYTCLSYVEIPKVRGVPNVDCDFYIRFNSGSCRLRSSLLSNIYGFCFVSNLKVLKRIS